MKEKQRGFIAIWLLTIVVIVAAVVGVIVWRLYDSNQKASPPANAVTHSATQPDPNLGYVVIKEWGVRFKPAPDLSSLVYSLTPGESYDQAVFSTTMLSAKAAACGVGSETLKPLGLLTRSKEVAQEFISQGGDFVKKIGDYYYHYITPQSVCATDEQASALQTQTVGLFKQSIQSIEPTK